MNKISIYTRSLIIALFTITATSFCSEHRPPSCPIGKNSSFTVAEKKKYTKEQIQAINDLKQEENDYFNVEISKIESTEPGLITNFFYQTITPYLCFLSGLGLFKYISQQHGDGLGIAGSLLGFTGAAFLVGKLLLEQQQKNAIRKEIFREIKDLSMFQKIEE